jgi:hypothetical protein
MSSLKKLQEKIGRLEIDQNNNNNDENDNKRTNETENRILKLEEQLEKMRKMVNENEFENQNIRIDWSNRNKGFIDLENDGIEKEQLDAEKKQTHRVKPQISEQIENVIYLIKILINLNEMFIKIISRCRSKKLKENQKNQKKRK